MNLFVHKLYCDTSDWVCAKKNGIRAIYDETVTLGMFLL